MSFFLVWTKLQVNLCDKSNKEAKGIRISQKQNSKAKMWIFKKRIQYAKNIQEKFNCDFTLTGQWRHWEICILITFFPWGRFLKFDPPFQQNLPFTMVLISQINISYAPFFNLAKIHLVTLPYQNVPNSGQIQNCPDFVPIITEILSLPNLSKKLEF